MAIDSLKDDVLVMGRIASPYGVKGWVRINTFTAEPGNLLDYSPWYVQQRGQWQVIEVLTGKQHGKGLVVHLKSCNDRDAAQATVRALRDYSNPLSLVRLARLHGTGHEMRESLLASDQWHEAHSALSQWTDPPELELDA